jgi:hypothetical protein
MCQMTFRLCRFPKPIPCDFDCSNIDFQYFPEIAAGYLSVEALQPYCKEMTTIAGVSTPPTDACRATSPMPSPAGSVRLN